MIVSALEGLFGLHVRLGRFDQRHGVWVEHPSARFTCRCGYMAGERSSPDRVRVFVEEVAAAHRAVCPRGRPL